MSDPAFKHNNPESVRYNDLVIPAGITRVARLVVQVALNVVQKNENGVNKYLLVQEALHKKDGGQWYLPAGRVDKGETFMQGLLRETKEEAGVEARASGIIAIQNFSRQDGLSKQRIIFFSEISDQDLPKSTPDQHSECAKWFSLNEILLLPLRGGNEILEYLEYIENGGKAVPLEFFKEYSV